MIISLQYINHQVSAEDTTMESHAVRPHGHHEHEQESLTSGMHGEAEHDHGGHHDMKPAVIINKVKEKAKKVKDKIKKRSHLHGHDHDGDQHHNSDDDSDEEEGDEDMVHSPEVHGAPMYDSERTGSALAGQMETSGQAGENVKRPSDSNFVGQERNAGMNFGGTTPGMQGNNQAMNTNPNRNLGRELEGSPGQSRLNLGRPVVLEVDSAAPKSQPAGPTASNYQSKVFDQTAEGKSGEEIGTTTIDQSMGKMSIHHDTESSHRSKIADEAQDAISSIAPTGSHDQFSPEFAPPRPQNTQAYDANKPRDREHQSSYTDQISSATSVVADKAVAAKDFVASKLGYGGEREAAGMHENGASYDNTKNYQDDQAMDTQRSQSASYTGTISSVAAAIPAAVAGTAMSAKNVVASKLGYGRKDDRSQEHQEEQHRPLSGSGVEHDKAKQIDEGSTYAGKISSAAAAIPAAVTGTAISAKNVVASKLGYGHPIHDTQRESTTKHEMEETTQEQDKGVSVKGYLSDKLKPGDEEKALSELISEALNLQKKDPQKDKHEEKPMGKVTESEEVAKRLGTEEDQSAEKVQSTFINAPGSSNVVDKVKSWFGFDFQPPQQSASSSSSQDSGHDSHVGGDRSPQESSN